MKSSESHYKNLERSLFAPGGAEAPKWLRACVSNCQERYEDIRLTDQFRSAINAFDDGGFPKPFELFVVGEGKFGKSTIVNCLLGEEQSKVRGLPETRCFLRYVVSDKPSETARIYLRAKRGVHDWILQRVGKGRHVKELFEILEHTVTLDTARELLDGEIERLDKGGYEPAIYEIEREIGRTKRTAFRGSVRVVDTQGLDQLFPDELKRITQGMADESSTERFLQWMNSSPRGKHLEWQFRRCDAVLWCVNAKRIGSAATLASLRYFSAYAKKIVIALTHVDQVAKNEMELARLLEVAGKKYGIYSKRIIPVNGLAAWSALSSENADQLIESGFPTLMNILGEVCEEEGFKVRNISRYLGLRQTESQFRSALSALLEDYAALRKKFESDRSRVIKSLEKDWASVLDSIKRTSDSIERGVTGRIALIEYRDERSVVDKKLDHSTEVARLTAHVNGQIDRVVLKNVAAQVQLTTAYRLPLFDADGNRSGSAFAISPELCTPSVTINLPYFRFVLGDWFDNAVDWMDEKFGWMAGGQEASNQRRAQRLQERWEHIAKVFVSEWNDHIVMVLSQVKNETVRQYQTLLDAIDSVFSRIEHHAGGSIVSAEQKIRDSLSGIAVPSVFQSQILAAIFAVRTGSSAKSDKDSTGSGRKNTVSSRTNELAVTKTSDQHFEIGRPVIHRKLGEGRILDVQGATYVVLFDEDGSTRKFNRQVISDPQWFEQG